MPASRHDHGRGSFLTGLRNARQNSSANAAYSVRCAHLRTAVTVSSTACFEACGKSQKTNGAMIRDERGADSLSLEATKMRPNQSTITSQYFRKTRVFDTAHSKQGSLGRSNLKLISFAQ